MDAWPTRLSTALIPTLLCSVAAAQVSISTAKGTEREVETREQLLSILERFDLGPWTFTDSVVIDERSIPHSHPVLTIHTRHNDDDYLLSTYVHEQLHWHLENLRQQTQATVAELRLLYPEVPVGGSEGARDEESTYLHLVVNYLELQVMRQLLGDERAEEVFDFWTGDHYTWIYATVLEDEGRIGAIIEAHGLSI